MSMVWNGWTFVFWDDGWVYPWDRWKKKRKFLFERMKREMIDGDDDNDDIGFQSFLISIGLRSWLLGIPGGV